MLMQLGSQGINSVNEDMRIKNLSLTFLDHNSNYSNFENTLYIDGGYIGRLDIGSVNNTMVYLDDTLHGMAWNGKDAHLSGFADFVCLQIVKDANRKGYKGFASTFDYIAHSGCSVEYISFDLIDMGSKDPEKTVKHYAFGVDWKSDPDVSYGDYNPNQKVGMDSKDSLCLVISEKYDLERVFEGIGIGIRLIDMPDVIEYDNEYGPFFHPLSAILNPNKPRVLYLDASWHSNDDYDDTKGEGPWRETLTITLHIGSATIELSQYSTIIWAECCDGDKWLQYSMEQRGPYIIASTLLNAINCCLGGPTYKENESLYEDKIIDIEGRDIDFTLENGYGCKNSLVVTVTLGEYSPGEYERYTDINITEFIPELIAEINDRLDFWSEKNEEYKKVLVHLMNRMMELFGNKIGLN